MQHETLLVVDFGSQVTQLIARRIRELGVYAEIVPCQRASERLASLGKSVRGIVLSGGPSSIYDDGAHGEAGATVTLEPAIDPARGPVYFGADVIPDRSLTETSEDGGVLYTNVPVGTYVMRAQKDGVTFEETTMKCEAGVLVNASPPYPRSTTCRPSTVATRSVSVRCIIGTGTALPPSGVNGALDVRLGSNACRQSPLK